MQWFWLWICVSTVFMKVSAQTGLSLETHDGRIVPIVNATDVWVDLTQFKAVHVDRCADLSLYPQFKYQCTDENSIRLSHLVDWVLAPQSRQRCSDPCSTLRVYMNTGECGSVDDQTLTKLFCMVAYRDPSLSNPGSADITSMHLQLFLDYHDKFANLSVVVVLDFVVYILFCLLTLIDFFFALYALFHFLFG